jgi:hypothetical protein
MTTNLDDLGAAIARGLWGDEVEARKGQEAFEELLTFAQNADHDRVEAYARGYEDGRQAAEFNAEMRQMIGREDLP